MTSHDHNRLRLKPRRRHTEPSGKPIVITFVLLGAAFLLMVLIWRLAIGAA